MPRSTVRAAAAFLACLGLACLLASCTRPVGSAPSGPAPPPSPAPAGPPPAAAPPAGPPLRCQAADFPPFGQYRLRIGYGLGSTEVEARQSAAAEATRLVAEQECLRRSAPACREVKARTKVPWGEPRARQSGAGSWEACVAAIAPASGIGEADGDSSARLDQALAGRVRALVAELDVPAEGLPVRLDGAFWLGLDGRAAGELGASLLVHLKAALREVRGLAIALVRRPGEVLLRAEVARAGAACKLGLLYQPPGGDVWRSLGGIDFEPGAVGARDCRPPDESLITDGHLGLDRGRRVGSDGLSVLLAAPLRDGRLCDGETYDWTAHVSRPAWVRVYSVTDDARVQLGWASEGPVTEWTRTAVAVQLPGGHEYRLVAVAVPAEAGARGFGTAVLGQADCLAVAGTGLPLDRLSPQAAAAALTYGIVPAGQEGCPDDAERRSLIRRVHDYLEKLPVCGARAGG